ncbi:hypothetical protein V2J09_014672 [Rumex salicifolius]
MGKGRPRAVEKGGGLGHGLNASADEVLNVPSAPVYYPSEEEFKDPLEFIEKIRAEAEPYGICKIVPPSSWKPPFALDLKSFAFPTKTQAIHKLQARPPSCDPKTFELEYNRFLESQCGRKLRKKVVFEGEELDLCKLFNAVKRFSGYDKVVKDKKWGEVFRFVKPGVKISGCAKHVLNLLYLEHLYDYEKYYNKLNGRKDISCKRGEQSEDKSDQDNEVSGFRKKRKSNNGESIKVSVRDEERDQICEQCKSGLHGDLMLLCDRCNKGWHTYCLSPPLEVIPPGNWYCFECLNSDEDAFGFVPGKHFSLEAFRKVDDRTKRKWFGSASCSRMQLEKKFWEIVAGALGVVEVMYGSDLDTSVVGSGFPRGNDQRPDSVDSEVWNKYCDSPWNLNNLPKLRGSMLQAVHHNIAGVMVPWLYIGMLFSAFCWHFEDHCFYSMNYHHWGDPKCWYSVPGSEASAFEKVMKNSLPDLFDAQPDLLFQLVTMLNPSVLQENGVPVYTEPGNFVITFPRSYHGGFNYGLNCAEAVNFAPADWLPHGGFGAELYKRYHKAVVLCHEELLCVVAKNGYDSKASPYLHQELLRVFSKEKHLREMLWNKGVIRMSVLSPRKHPGYVGTEEDPSCIICQQYLYLSAVVCRCRPRTFVCLEHSEQLCECNPRKRRLLYRHSLAEMNEMLLVTENNISKEMWQSRSLRRQNSFSADLSILKKKVKGKQVSLSQLAEQWLLRTSDIFQLPFSVDAYAKALKEAEQFLWAGSEMDAVRDTVKHLVEAKNWAESVRNSLSCIEKWINHDPDVEKVHWDHISKLLEFDPLPCTEPGYSKLKEYGEGAKILDQEICELISKLPLNMSKLENEYKRALEFPIHINASEQLSQKISVMKAWINNVRQCVQENCPSKFGVHVVQQLKAEMIELQVDLPESEMLKELVGCIEVCKTRCAEMLKSGISLKELKELIDNYQSLSVDIPELKLLREYYSDAISWNSRFDNVMSNVEGREDVETVVNELSNLQKDGSLLKVQVDGLSVIDIELQKACCREKALQACTIKKPFHVIQQVLSEAASLQIDKDELFVVLSKALISASSWEERAQHIISVEAPISDFDDAIRSSKDICAILPSLPDIEESLSDAMLWLETSRPFLQSTDHVTSGSSLWNLDDLKEQVSSSKFLRVSFAERSMIETLLKKCEKWKCDACCLLKNTEDVFNVTIVGNEISYDLVLKINKLVQSTEGLKAAGLSLGFNFPEMPRVENAFLTLRWCSKVISLSSLAAQYEEVNSLSELAKDLPTMYSCSSLLVLLIESVSWLKKALEVLTISSGFRNYQLTDVDELIVASKKSVISFPAVVINLENAVEKHMRWQEKVQDFFSSESSQQSWSSLLHLKELGKTDAYSCVELNLIVSQLEAVLKWKLRVEEVVRSSLEDETTMLNSLLKVEIKNSLHRSLYIYEKLKGSKVRFFCTGCSGSSEDQEYITYHMKCLVTRNMDHAEKDYMCSYCLLVESGSICQSGESPLRFKGKSPELEVLNKLLLDAEEFHIRIEEKEILQDIVDQALTCRTCLTEIVNLTLTCVDGDVSFIFQNLTIALKALDVMGVYDAIATQKFDNALARNSWRVRSIKLLEDSQKPLIQQIQRHLKEASTINITSEDYFNKKFVEMKQTGIRWAETAKKVSADNGELQLDRVFDLITEGGRLPINFEKELKLLRDRSVLYCICRKPYNNQRAMIACDHCDEWYHFDCVNLVSPPKVYICPACTPLQLGDKALFTSTVNEERQSCAKSGEPQTPSPRQVGSRQRPKKTHFTRKPKLVENIEYSNQRQSRSIDHLTWTGRKANRRAARKRTDLQSFCFISGSLASDLAS